MTQTKEIDFGQHRRIFNVNGPVRPSVSAAGQAIKLFEWNLTAACPLNYASTKTPIHKATSETVLEMQ